MVTVSQVWRNFGAMIESLSQVDRQFPVILLYGDPATLTDEVTNEAIRRAGENDNDGRVIIIHNCEV